MTVLRSATNGAIALLVLAAISACQTAQITPKASKAQITVENVQRHGAASGDRLTVMAYNIRMGIGAQKESGRLFDMPWGKKLDAVIAEIRGVNPDVVGLQEVAGPMQANKIGRALDMNVAYVPHETVRKTGRWWGVAVLSKFPIRSTRAVEISFGRGNQRTVLLAELDVGTRRMTVLSIHKDKDLHDGSSIANIMEIVAPIEGPVVLAGDFNFTPDKSRGRMEMLQTRFVDTATATDTKGARDARQWGTFVRSKRRIDYVFADPHHFEVLDAGVTLPPVPASDHRAYFTVLRFK